MKKSILLAAYVLMATAITAVPANTQTASCSTTTQAQTSSGFFDTILTNVLVPTLEDIASAWLPHLVNHLLPPGSQITETPITFKQCSKPTSVNNAVAVGIAYTIYKVDAGHAVAKADANTTYKTGEGATLVVTNNITGFLEVANVDGRGIRTVLETLKLRTIGPTILPATQQGFYALDAASGDETLELTFFPCNTSSQPSNEALTIQPAADVHAAVASQIKPEVSAALPSCPTQAAVDAAAHVAEALVIQPSSDVAIATQELALQQQNSSVQPIRLRLTLKRSS